MARGDLFGGAGQEAVFFAFGLVVFFLAAGAGLGGGVADYVGRGHGDWLRLGVGLGGLMQAASSRGVGGVVADAETGGDDFVAPQG